MNKFIHLRVHSAYSLAQSTLKINDIVALAKKEHMPAVGMCDQGNLFGSLEFSEEAIKKGIKPIIGCKMKILNPFYKEFDSINIFAKNKIGLQNLIKLNSESFLNLTNTNVDPHINYNRLTELKEGLIILSGASEGTLGKLLLKEEKDKAISFIKNLSDIFKNNIYIELIRQDNIDDHKIEEDQINFAYDLNLPLVATNPVFYPSEKMYEAFDVLSCISTNDFVQNEKRQKPKVQAYFKSIREMNELFSDIKEAIENTIIIAERCSAVMHSRAPMLPKFTDNGIDDEEELFAKYAKEGLKERLEKKKIIENLNEEQFAELAKTYFERLEFEINVISKMKFCGYFLIVSDFIKWSKKNNIPVGPGRGSGAGSLVAWSLEITNLDPIRFGLLFERFLNPDRVSMPDFDIDFCQDKRDEVINYVKMKYGEDKVAQIITFGKLQARAVLRDVGRVLQVELAQVNDICKMVPFNPVSPVTLEEALDLEPSIRKRMAESRDIDRMVNIALKLEGLFRHVSTHAAGVVIADKPLIELVPLYYDERSSMPVVQYSMKYAEMAGLVKFDFLGLKTLTVIQHVVNMLQEQGIELNIDNISFKDKKTYELLSNGDSTGVFQFESGGMKDALRKLKPDAIEDLIALGALYRPGPMENIPTYIARKHGLEEPDYIHPKLENALKETFGVIIYQEQVMQIAQLLAGYTLGAADLLRRAMGKKIKAEMDAQREIFVKGSIENGIDADQATQIFNLVDKFAGYGFNKSHAAAYAVISYQTAFLKANYTVEFLIASLNYDIHDTDKISIFIQEARNFNIKVLPPSINFSYPLFSLEFYNGKKCIRYALSALKNVSKQVSETIIEEREKNGKFSSLEDFAKRMNDKPVNKKVVENFAKAGAFDELNPNRNQIFENTENILNFITRHENSKNDNTDQFSLFSSSVIKSSIGKLNLSQVEEWSPLTKLSYEFEVYGFYFSGHPLDEFKEYIKRLGVSNLKNVYENSTESLQTYYVASVPLDVKIKASRKGRFGSLLASDQTGNYEISMFNKEVIDMYDENKSLFNNGAPVILKIEAKKDEGGVRFFLRDIDYLVNKIINATREIIFETSSQSITDFINRLKEMDHSTTIKIKFYLPEEKRFVLIKLPKTYKVDALAIDLIQKNIQDLKIIYN
ncbi:MAG: DNA polymerase III subunit alpha [Sphingobacteriia bacterium]|nr:DNA polymerase III subunit alpha [Sphingobacteriia bacterium]